MKTHRILFCVLLFYASLDQTMTDVEVPGRKQIAEQDILTPSFIWKTPLGLHVEYPSGLEDYINLEPVFMSGAPVKCLFRGHFFQDSSSSAVIAGCKEDDNVSITIVAKELWGRTAFEVTNGFVEEVENPYTGDLHEEYDEDDYDYEDQVERGKRSIYEDYQDEYDSIPDPVETPPPELTTLVKLAFDRSLRDKMGSEEAAKTYVKTVAQLGSLYLENFSPQTKIFLNFVDKIEFFDEIMEPSYAKLQRAIELKKSNPEAFPMVIFTSKADNNVKMGISPGLPGKACDPHKGVSLLKYRSQKSLAAITFAHELGHEHGIKHDYKEKPPCTGEGIMSVVGQDLSLNQRPTTFSSCSAARFSKWYRNYGFRCMLQGNVKKISTVKFIESKVENMKSKLEHLEDKCSALTALPGALLNSGCNKPDQLQDGTWVCSQDGSSCHAACRNGFKENKNTIIKCDQSRWIPDPGRMLNSVVLLTGGFTDSGHSSVEVFSPWNNGTCSKDLEDLPKGRVDHTLNIFQGQVIACGGQLSFNLEYCHTLDQHQRFVPHSRLNYRRAWHMAAVASDKLLMVGGFWSNSVESWNGSQWSVQENNFNDVRPGNEGQESGCMASINEDTILMAGGNTFYKHPNGKPTNKMFKFQNGMWEQMEDFPGPPRYYHGCTFLQTNEGGAYLIAGGRDDNYSELDTSYLYNIEKREWEEVGKLAAPRSSGKILVVDGRVIIVGGHDGTGDSKERNKPVDVEEYNMETKTWTTIQKKIKRGRYNFGAVVIPGDIVGC